MARTIGSLLFTIALAAQAQQPPPTTLTVVVTDNKGSHVHGLARDDFQLTARGAKGEIANITESTAVPRRIAVLFDLTSISLQARHTSTDALHEFLAKSLRPGDKAIVLTAGQNLTPLSQWTADPSKIDDALQRAGTATSVTMAGDRDAAERHIRELITDIQQASVTFYNFDTVVEAARGYASLVYRDGRQSIGLLEAAASLFPPGGSRNVMIVIGAGLPQRPGADMFQYIDNIKREAEQGQLGGALRGGAARSSPMSETVSFDLTPFLEALAAGARDKGVAIYAIDAQVTDSGSAQVEANRAADRIAAFTTIANRSAGYQILADQSGGVAFVAQRPADALAQILGDLDAFYSITVKSPASLTSGDPVVIRSKPGYTVRIARGGTSPDADVQMRSRVIANHIIPADSNDLGISVVAGAPVVEGDKRRIPLKVMIPVKNLKFVQDGNMVTGGFTVYISTGDAAGHSSNINKQAQQLRWPVEALQGAGDRKLTFAVDVVLEPGRTQISIGVLDQRSEATGYDRVSI